MTPTTSRLFPLMLATTNEGKRSEWNQILRRFVGETAPQVSVLEAKLDLIELQSIDPVKVAITKAVHARKLLGHAAIIEDVSFELMAICGFPGALYAPFEKAAGIQGIIDLMRDKPHRRAVVTAVVAFVDETQVNIVQIVTAKMYGHVPEQPRGTNGFGFDSIFVPDGHQLTLAEMTSDQKNEISMRRMVIEALVAGQWTPHSTTESPLS